MVFLFTLHLLNILIYILPLANSAFVLKPLSTMYLQYDINLNGFDQGAAEISVFDSKTSFAYIVGDKLLQVVDFSVPSTPSLIYQTSILGKGSHVELCNEFVAVAMKATTGKTSPGTVSIFGVYQQGVIDKFQDITVGVEPTMLTFTEDCRTLLVANEGGADESRDGTKIVDPEGTISILRFPSNDLTQLPNKQTVNFNTFDSRSSEYESKGVRMPYKGNLGTGTSTFSQSMEPEYITLNADETLAYVTLQENNAVAVVDIARGNVIEIYPLGFKNWNSLKFDSCDTDLEINMRSWPIYSFYQPDVIKYFNFNGEGYLAMVNEGKMIDYETSNGTENWTESARGSQIISNNLLAENVSSELKSALSDNNKLGRLQFSKVDGLNQLGKIQELYFYGGRGWSIVRVKDMKQVYDSGDEVEQKHAELLKAVFNAESTPDSDEKTPSQLKDQKSDDTGPECETLAVGDLDNKKLFFIGIEGSSSVVIYSIGSNLQPQFESVYRAGEIRASFKTLYDNKTVGDLDPKGLRFISAAESPTKTPLLLLTGTVSGTVSLYEIVNEGSGSSSTNLAIPLWLLVSMTIVSIVTASTMKC